MKVLKPFKVTMLTYLYFSSLSRRLHAPATSFPKVSRLHQRSTLMLTNALMLELMTHGHLPCLRTRSTQDPWSEVFGMSEISQVFDQQVVLLLRLDEPMEPKHRDISVVKRVGSGYATQSFNLPSTSLLETRIGFLAREAVNEMADFIHGIGGDAADSPPAEVIQTVRNEFARGKVRVRLTIGTARGGTNVDADNCLKLTLDALCPVIFPNDRHVAHAVVEYSEDIGAPIAPTWVMVTRERDEPRMKSGEITGAYVFPARNASKAPCRVPILNQPIRP